jgi:hypothetical protein
MTLSTDNADLRMHAELSDEVRSSELVHNLLHLLHIAQHRK